MGWSIKRAPLAVSLLAAINLAACGYFNTMYNADRAFSEAERAASRGDAAIANAAYTRAVQKASSQVAKDSAGRYADDALLIMGRSWIALGQLDSAVSALNRLTAFENSDPAHAANAWLGAVAAARGDTAVAAAALNAALASDRLDDYTKAVAYLWRARVHFQKKDFAAARQDVDLSARASKRLAAPAALLGARIALETRDTAAMRKHFGDYFATTSGAFFTDSIRSLTREFRDKVDPAMLAGAMATVHDANWPPMRRDSIALLLVSLLEQSGDTTRAIAEADRIARRSTPPLSDDARITAARLMLARTQAASELANVRGILLPALGNTQARNIVQTLRTIDVLLETAARTGQPLALFVAAEISRDQLNAPLLARQLFVAYADVARGSDWSGKALIAAAALPQPADSVDALQRRISEMRENIYVAALHGEDDNDAFADAEQRLARTAAVLRTRATLDASQNETTVGRAIALIDSVREAARTDSLKLSCGMLIDSLAVSGIRADSIHSACMRHDRERIDVLIKIDTLLLRDTTKVQADSLRARTDSLRVRADTMNHQP